jgi:replicative DNA helicase Mcm
MSLTTASDGLAEDYADALSKLGVATRIHHDESTDAWKTYVMGDSAERFVEAVVEPADDRYEQAREFAERGTETRRHHDVLPTGAVEELRDLRRLVGLPLTGEYHTHLENGYGVQVETVRAEIRTLRERIAEVRAAVEDVETLSTVRDAVGWSGRQLAERLDGETTSSVHYAEDGGYDAARRERMAAGAERAVADALGEAERRVDDLEQRLDLRYYRVTDVERVENHDTEWVYDVTVEPTNTFVGQGVVLHNSVSISKAGINATLKSRCSLLGAANPKYGRFDQYEPIGEQIDLEPALISRFDLIFTVTDEPDEEEDRRLAEHILNSNYAGELNTQQIEMTSPDVDPEEVAAVTEEVDPTIDAELLRKYIAYAKQNCHPRMTEAAQQAIQKFYTDLRSKGTDEDAPVPVTARKLEATVRLAEASARVRLSDEVTAADAERVIEIVRSCLRDVGVDPESGDFDADVVETGTSKTQRDRIQSIKTLISEVQDEYEEGAPVEVVMDRATDAGMDQSKVDHEIEKLKQRGEIYEPSTDHLRTT